MVLNNVYQLKHIQLTKYMHICTQNIYHVHYATQWILIIFNNFSYMTVTSPKRAAETVRRFYHSFLRRGEFYFDVVGNFEPKKITPNCNALAKSIISYLTFESLPFNLIFLTVYYYVVYKQKSIQ